MRVFALLAALAAAGGCLPAAFAVGADSIPSAANSSPVAISGPALVAEANYRIVEDDVLRLDVWGEPQLSGMQFQVTPGGKINVPYLGDMPVVGLTQTEVSQLIAKKLADAGIVYDAKVQVSMITLHKSQVHVLGAVTRPGTFDFKDGNRVLEGVAQGGSYSEDALLEGASLTHKDSDKPIPIDLKKLLAGDHSQNYVLQNGDVIYIPHEDYKNKFYVLGQVNRPGQYSLKDRTTILAAISLAGGVSDRGAIRSTVVMRGDPAKPEKVKADFKKLFDKGDLSQDLVLKPGDIVVVPGAKKIDWYQISSIINAAINITSLRRLGF